MATINQMRAWSGNNEGMELQQRQHPNEGKEGWSAMVNVNGNAHGQQFKEMINKDLIFYTIDSINAWQVMEHDLYISQSDVYLSQIMFDLNYYSNTFWSINPNNTIVVIHPGLIIQGLMIINIIYHFPTQHLSLNLLKIINIKVFVYGHHILIVRDVMEMFRINIQQILKHY